APPPAPCPGPENPASPAAETPPGRACAAWLQSRSCSTAPGACPTLARMPRPGRPCRGRQGLAETAPGCAPCTRRCTG
nr:hypothetical protein [Tanacetum cinerariifolium]